MKRRTFLRRGMQTGIGVSIAGSLAVPRFPLFAAASSVGRYSDQVLVVVQLAGGNDGLNTVIPVDEDLYYKLRPRIAVEKGVALPIYGEPLLRLHPGMEGMQKMFNQGELAIVENIGYDQGSLSHFTGTEIWNTASGTGSTETFVTGWLGRFLHAEFPTYPEQPVPYPPAIQMGAVTSSLLAISGASMGMALTDPAEFHELVSGGAIVAEEGQDDSLAGREWRYIQLIDAQSVQFADVVRVAAGRGRNMVEYPAGNTLAGSLAVIARLIAGGLPTPVYVVSLGGFDTHAGQLIVQPLLLRQLSDALSAFADDLAALNLFNRVVTMTVSEFGRRVEDNWLGTDHGGAAPHFVFGGGIDGGRVYGGLPNLGDLDTVGNLRHAIDFRCYYASVLAPLFGLDEARIGEIVPVGGCQATARVPLYRGASVTSHQAVMSDSLNRLDIRPNPASERAEVLCRQMVPGMAKLSIIASDGHHVMSVSEEIVRAGSCSFTLDLSSVPSGSYIIRIDGMDQVRSASLVVRR